MEDKEKDQLAAPFQRMVARVERMISPITAVATDSNVVATLKLLEYLRSAIADDAIKSSKQVTSLIEELIENVQNLPISKAKSGAGLEKALAVAKLRRTAKRNAANSRKPDGYRETKKICEEWFGNPSLYKNRSAVQKKVMEMGLCDTEKTARGWIKKAIDAGSPSDAWYKMHPKAKSVK
ncbi:hypothetical protein [Herbaspirillum frisingense]|uniref:hypothetical protein n=1 Tax=Herbaspirillum frisingense TaxID=92645 RepID=UPI001F397CF5|nr:hypothetical protein [Herbaspirillum frisingense]UIN23514.1 hypothetical protein LAZ82_10630 [Herbaspirillum frisingense]